MKMAIFGPALRAILLTLAICSATSPSAADSKEISVEIAKDGRAFLPIVIGRNADERTRAVAADLSRYLQRITGAEFEVQTGDGTRGIVVGLPCQFPELPFSKMWPEPTARERENYLLRSHAKGVWLIGATELAVEHAVWDLLHRIGYRQYFPGEHWEIVPQHRTLSVAVDTVQSPDYHGRRIWYGYGPWDYAVEPYRQWCARNRAVMGIDLHTGHAYGGIIRANKSEFDKHPEYFAMVDGKRRVHPQGKFCISNENLRQLVAEHAVRHFQQKPDDDSISLDPSDGGGWCECEACTKLGSVSNRALMLANEAAAAINRQENNLDGRTRYVGMYAYNYHSPPPTIRVHPNVVISVATAFIKGGNRLEDLVSGWSRQGATLGIREYYSVNTWDRDMPARARGGRIDYLRETIPAFHAEGARFMSAESSDNWGPNGLGYYLATRMLWDVDEASQIDELTEDFLSRCFGPAKEPMREFYQQLDGSKPHLVFDDQLGKMFRALDSAQHIIDTDKDTTADERTKRIEARLNDLLLYARYVDLFDRYQRADGSARQAAFEAMIRHTYRMRTTMLVHAKAVYRDVVARDKQVTIPAGATWAVAESKNPWKSSAPFTTQELREFLSEGIERHPLLKLDFEPVAFSEDLVSAAPLNLETTSPGVAARGRGSRTYYTYVAKAPTQLTLNITGGLIAHYRDRGNVRVELVKIGGESETGERETVVANDDSTPPDGKKRAVTIPVKTTGLHKLRISDGGDLTSVEWPSGWPICFKSSLDEPIKTSGRWSLYFYVPRGTKVIGMYGGGSPGTILNPAGKKVFTFDDRKAGFYSIPVTDGTDGQLWKVHQAAGAIRLLTVPPYLARSADEVLLPREVVQRDAE